MAYHTICTGRTKYPINKQPPAKPVVLLMRAKPSVPRVRVKRVSTTYQLRKMVSLLPVLLFLPKLKSYCLLYGLALPGLLITFHLTLISDAPCYVFVLSAIFTFSWRGVSFCLHRHRLNRTTRPASGFTYTIKPVGKSPTGFVNEMPHYPKKLI